jgi:DNA-directed RNA polymerase specialized sigma24 family protein
MADVTPKFKKDWVLTREAFDTLLARMDSDRGLAAEKYEVLRCTLIRMFEWRNCPLPDVHADDVLNIVARRIQEGEVIEDVMSYACGVARMLCLEVKKKRGRELGASPDLRQSMLLSEEDDETKLLHECLEKCLGKLPDESREMILSYYQGAKQEKIDHRRVIAKKFNITLNVLRIKTCRVRAKLENCINDCLKNYASV